MGYAEVGNILSNSLSPIHKHTHVYIYMRERDRERGRGRERLFMLPKGELFQEWCLCLICYQVEEQIGKKERERERKRAQKRRLGY
jgi:hypothetical protein